ncbi:MAG: hypothetical protein BZ151_05910 [Desulfobacca sp. 4484_104]|nr:MAG: hypothetical protein BZ151_05910 [Desulfobacca sp. 4484_104]
MLEMARLVGTPRKGIILQTRAGRNVENSQSCEPDVLTRERYDLLRRKYYSWINRKPACGVYNCFGLVWASRRTAIYDESELSKILTDDGYRRLATEEQIQHGDVILYRLDGNTLHAAMALELRQLQLESSKMPWVLSKWGNVFGEDIHHFLDVPDDIRECSIEIWTDRP